MTHSINSEGTSEVGHSIHSEGTTKEDLSTMIKRAPGTEEADIQVAIAANPKVQGSLNELQLLLCKSGPMGRTSAVPGPMGR
jgi:hypothetical protein